jgi:hypothetical protein
MAVRMQEIGAAAPRQRDALPHLENLKVALAALVVDETNHSLGAALAGTYLRAVNPQKTDDQLSDIAAAVDRAIFLVSSKESTVALQGTGRTKGTTGFVGLDTLIKWFLGAEDIFGYKWTAWEADGKDEHGPRGSLIQAFQKLRTALPSGVIPTADNRVLESITRIRRGG